MNKSFPLDLKVARRKSGLTQADCAHLLGVYRVKISHLERGEFEPSLRDICTLSLIYGRSFESLFSGVFEDLRHELRERLLRLPASKTGWVSRFNRTGTLNRLAKQLDALDERSGDRF